MDGQQWYGAAYKGSSQPGRRAPGEPDRGDREPCIDLNEHLVRNKPATFFFRMNSDAMTDAGIHSGDILIVDRSIKAVSGKVIVAVLNGDLLVRRLQTHIKGIDLVAENKRYGNIHLEEFSNYAVWGTVTFVIHQV